MELLLRFLRVVFTCDYVTETPSMPNEIPNEILEITDPNACDQCDVCHAASCCHSLQGGFQFKAFAAFTHPGSETTSATMPPHHHVSLVLLTGRGRAFCSVGAA